MILPIISLQDMNVLPGMKIHFDINRPKSIAAVEYAMLQDQRVFVIMQKNAEVEEPKIEDFHLIGTIVTIKQILKTPKEYVRIMADGEARAQIKSLNDNMDFLEGELIPVTSDEEGFIDPLMEEAMCRILKEQILLFSNDEPSLTKDFVSLLLSKDSVGEIIVSLIQHLPLTAKKRQKYLDTITLVGQYDLITQYLNEETKICRFRNEFQAKVKARIDKNQRDYFLREQMKLIQDELGEDQVSEADRFRQMTEELQAPDEVKEKLNKEINRFKMIPSGSQEATVSRTYIETMLDIPWSKTSKDNQDLKRAAKILDEDHYGLEKVKERILEHLAVQILTGKSVGTILCLVGPPGTGKTSIAQSVARGLNKVYSRMSLGGVRDEAEIRGHRKTYVGAMPGRIVSAIRQAGVSNPLLLLDEIDKVGADYKGDPSSALLEVLDPEQNKNFRDHYLEVPMDLSQVLFLATANTSQTIPQPLLDRMEIIEVHSYTENEKYHIARDFLLSKQIKKNGLNSQQLKITKKAMEIIIHNYTREAGVRELERKLAQICRMAARKILEGEIETVKVIPSNLADFLGRKKILFKSANNKDEVGIVRGLAWTSMGGTTLQIEVNIMPGSGTVQLTGKLGDVMKESAQAALSYIRSISESYQIPNDYFEKHDIHIHVPEGAVPKDGPSAGITMATAMFSAVTGTPVKADLAMTGEVTLRGHVLVIGGLKEKLLAAKQADIHTVIVPDKNKPDVVELSAEITGGLTIHYVKDMQEVLKVALAN